MAAALTKNSNKEQREDVVSDEEEQNSKNAKQTPITPSASGYRLRNHSYQQANTSVSQYVVSHQPIQEDSAEDMGSMEDIVKPQMLIRKEEWQGKTQAVKLDTVFEAVNKMYAVQEQFLNRIKPLEYAVFDKENGILPQLSGLASCAKVAGSKQQDLEADNRQLREELEIVKGVVSKQGKQIQALQNKLADQTARAMADHIVINGILADAREADELESIALFSGFLEEQMEIECNREEVLTAYRLGHYVEGKHRPMVLKLDARLQREIFANTTKLGGKQNEEGRSFSVNPLLPDLLAEQRREIRQIIKDKKVLEKNLPKAQKSNFLVRNGRVFINGQQKKKTLMPPDLRDLFVDSEEQLKINRIKTKTVEEPPIKGSKFKAVAVSTPKLNDVHLAYKKMFQLYPHTDHIVAAFNAENEEGFQDNGEFGAGHRVLKTIQDSKLYNVSVFVVREYGGRNLGPLRFNIFQNMALKALEALT